jgi:hypothetical protein
MSKLKEDTISVNSIFGAYSGLPLVELQLNGEKTQLELHQAREIALWLIEAAAVAETDGLVFMALQNNGASVEMASQMILMVREQREKKGKRS